MSTVRKMHMVVVFALLGCVAGSSSVRAASLVAQYEFENAGNLGQDISGLANDGTAFGGVSQAAGAYGGSSGAFFDGAGGTRIQAGPLTGYTGLPGFSMSAWVKQDPAASGFDGIISQDGGGCCQTRFLISSSKSPYINVHQHSDRHLNTVALPVNSWYHVALTANNEGGQGVARVYVNGLEVRQSPQIFQALGSSAGFSTYLGSGEGGTGHPFRGTLDDVQIYEGALSDWQVHYLAEHPGAAAPADPNFVNIPLAVDGSQTTPQGFGGSAAGTLTDPFSYDPNNPTATLPDQVFGGSNAYHSNNNVGPNSIAYTFQDGSHDNVLLDLWGRITSNEVGRHQDLTVELFNGDWVTPVHTTTGFSGVGDGNANYYGRWLAPESVMADRMKITKSGDWFVFMEARAAFAETAQAGDIPEPATMIICSLGMLASALYARRRRG